MLTACSSGQGGAASLLAKLGMNSRCRISIQKKSSAELTLFCPASMRTPQCKPAQRQTCHSNSAGLRFSCLKPHPKSAEISEEAWKWSLDQAHSQPSVISLAIYHRNGCNSPQGEFLVFKQLLPCIISSCCHKRKRNWEHYAKCLKSPKNRDFHGIFWIYYHCETCGWKEAQG